MTAFLASLAAIGTALSDLIMTGWRVRALIQEAKLQGWVTDGRSISQQIAEAKTNEERKILARRLAGHDA